MINKIAVIGSGVMGCGIAQSFASQGYSVSINDIKDDFLKRARHTFETQLDLVHASEEQSAADTQTTLSRCTFTTNLEEAVADADWVIEAIPEVIEMKWQLYKRIESLIRSNALVSSNTSTFPLSTLTKNSLLAERFLITHFFNPAHLVPLVEIVKKNTMTDEQLFPILDSLRKTGKKPIVLKKEINGFIANRLQTALMREAFALISQGIADPEDVDQAVTEGIGFRWAFLGPTRIADLGGLDTWKRVFDNIAPDLDKSEGAPELINLQVAANQLGAKTGKGLYDYSTGAAQRILHQRDKDFLALMKEKNKLDAEAL